MIATARAFAGLLFAMGAVLSIGAVSPMPSTTPHQLLWGSTVLWKQEPGRISARGEVSSRVLVMAAFSHLDLADLDLAGTYIGRAPANDAAKRVYSLVLTTDGKALWSTFFLGKDRATQPAHWRQTGSELVLDFDKVGPGSPPRPITFHYHHHELRPIHWDQSEWGRAGPPVLHRQRDGPAEARSA